MRLPARIAIALVFAACLGAAAQPLDGVWRSQGWGSLYEIRGGSMRTFEVTASTCVEGFRATRIPPHPTETGASFRERNGDMIRITLDSDSDRGRISRPDWLVSIGIERIASLPRVCTPPTPNTPAGNFDVFAQTFAEHYISFDLRGIDWQSAIAVHRSKVGPSTSPAQLFDILGSMIRPLHDIHTGIEAPKLNHVFDAPLREGTDRAMRGNVERFETSGRRELASITNAEFLKGPLQSFCRGQWQYGSAGMGIGYLRLLSFGSCSRRGGFESSVAALNTALDKVFESPGIRALVIDVRLSFGGDDRIGLAIASRLTRAEYMAYSIQTRSDPADPGSYTPPQKIMVHPSARRVFSGPVVQLIGPITMSAAETFTQALMGRTPRVVRIGENTQGVFCDVLSRHLPNGWSFGLPNSVYRTSEGRAFDVTGIPPDVAVPVFADADLAARRDPAMALAIKLLATSIENMPGR